MAQTIGLQLPADRPPEVEHIARVFRRQIHFRCGASVRIESKGEVATHLAVAPGIGAEGFRIDDVDGGVRVTGNDTLGLLHGVGKLLRESRFEPGRFVPGAWRGTSVPRLPVRGIYFATHFHNWYHDAPVHDVQRYVEELGLWGYNALAVWFDMHHYTGMDDPEAQAMVARLRAILQSARNVGMRTALTTLANEAYANSPEPLRSDPNTRRAHYRVELCPSIPEAMDLMLRWHDERLQAFADLEPDYLWLWPYDQGGCACAKCAPWGSNGFLKISEKVARLYRDRFPRGRVVLSTWLFDMHENQGEWEGLTEAFRTPPEWVDYVMVESHAEFPRYPLEHGVPGGLPMINFPEISMRGMFPWGGFGANPTPQWFQHLWHVAGEHLSGGFPYSEGIFEDINKALWAQFYWDGRRTAIETVREYAAFEYSPDVADAVVRAVEIFEANHHRGWSGAWGELPEPVTLPPDAGSREAFRLLQEADQRLTPQASSAWRWRILLLRALIDAELFANGGKVTARCEKAFEELEQIFCAQNSEIQVHPPVRSLRSAAR